MRDHRLNQANQGFIPETPNPRLAGTVAFEIRQGVAQLAHLRDGTVETKVLDRLSNGFHRFMDRFLGCGGRALFLDPPGLFGYILFILALFNAGRSAVIRIRDIGRFTTVFVSLFRLPLFFSRYPTVSPLNLHHLSVYYLFSHSPFVLLF